MKSIGQKINVVSDPLIITAQIEVDGTADQIFNPSRNEWIPNRKVLNNEVKMTAVLKGYDPNISSNGIVINNVVWAINGNQISDYGEGDFVVDATNHTLTCYANGTGNSAFNIEATIHYYNTTTGDREVVTASKSITTTMNDAEEFVLVPTTSQDGIYNPMRGEGGRYVEFGCKLMSGNKQTPAVYRWFVITWDSNNKKIETAVNGTESWFKGGYSYNYEEDENGVIIENSWEKKDSLDANTWGAIKVDLEYAQGVNLVVKAGASWAGETNSDVKDSLQLKYRASREFPMLKRINMHAVQGYVTKPNGNLEASVFKAYAKVFVGSEELDGAKEDEKNILEKYFNLTWYKTINNVKTRIGYGAVLSITYKDLGIVKKDPTATNNPSGIEYIDESTIPSIHVEVSENYISGGVQGAVYSNYETPNPKAVFGNDSIADELAAYLVETTYNEDGTTTIDAKRLMKNNWFRYENGQPAPTMLCNEAQYANIMTIPENEREYNNNGEWTHLGVPVACYNPPEKNSKPSGINLNLDILYGWSEPVWTVEMHTNNSGEVVCYFAKEPFEIEEDGKVLEAVKIPPTLISPALPTLHNGKFRTMFFLDGCGYGSNGTAGAGNIITTFNDTSKAWVATSISNNSNNTYSFAKNKDANNDNTPYAPLMHWHYNNILCALETKFKSAILHDDSMFGAGISSNLAPLKDNTTTYKHTGITYETNNVVKVDSMGSQPDFYDTSGKKHNWSEWLSNQGSRMVCLEQQMVLSWTVENIKLEYKNNKGAGRCVWIVVNNKAVRTENPYSTLSSACSRVFAGETIYVHGISGGSAGIYPYILTDTDMNVLSIGNGNFTGNLTIEQDGWLLVNDNRQTALPERVCIRRSERPIFTCPIYDLITRYKVTPVEERDIEIEMSARVSKRYWQQKSFLNSTGEEQLVSIVFIGQTSCVHGIDLVSADVFQCQNGIENILTVEKEGNVDGNPRTIWICKDQTKLYRGTEATIASGEKYPFETDGTYELLGESKKTNGWGNDFLRGTCIPTEDGGSLSKISGYYYATNYGNTTKGNRNRMSFRGRGYATDSHASARVVYAFSDVSYAFVNFAGGFQIRLPEKDVSETT